MCSVRREKLVDMFAPALTFGNLGGVVVIVVVVVVVGVVGVLVRLRLAAVAALRGAAVEVDGILGHLVVFVGHSA